MSEDRSIPIKQLAAATAFPAAPRRTPQEETAWLTRLDQQKETLRVSAPEPTRVKLIVFDQEKQSLMSLEFEAFPLTVSTNGDNYGDTVITTFSNGCVLTQRKVAP